MAVPKPLRSKIRNAVSEFGAAATEIAVVKDHYPGRAERLDGGNVITEISRQSVQLVASIHAEAVSLKSRIGEETGSGTWKWTLVPRFVPLGIPPINPGILAVYCYRYTQGAKHQANVLHCVPLSKRFLGPGKKGSFSDSAETMHQAIRVGPLGKRSLLQTQHRFQ